MHYIFIQPSLHRKAVRNSRNSIQSQQLDATTLGKYAHIPPKGPPARTPRVQWIGSQKGRRGRVLREGRLNFEGTRGEGVDPDLREAPS